MHDDKLINCVNRTSTVRFSCDFRAVFSDPPALMALDLDQVRRIAHLARIEVTDDEAQRTLDQLSDIFAMIRWCRSSLASRSLRRPSACSLVTGMPPVYALAP